VTDSFTQEYGKAQMLLHNAQQTLNSREHRHRKLGKQIKMRKEEIEKMSASLAQLDTKIEKAKAELKAAKDTYRPLRQEYKRLKGEPR
jgi:chromosome segregation ATPase